MTTRLLVLADTHLGAGRADRLPAAARDAAARADLVLHAGDVTDGELLRLLGTLAPTHAVLGNNDRDLVGVLPEHLELTVDGVRIAMVHDAGPRKGRERRLRDRFPDADLVVFGHSHDPVAARDGDRWLLNPGSPTQRRRAPQRTFAVVDLADGEVASIDHVVVDP